jgi:hypothetical protein
MLTKVLQNVHFFSAREGNLTREFTVTNETSNTQRVLELIAFGDAKQASVGIYDRSLSRSKLTKCARLACSGPLVQRLEKGLIIHWSQVQILEGPPLKCRSSRLYSLNWTCRKLACSLGFSISNIPREDNSQANALANSTVRKG